MRLHSLVGILAATLVSAHPSQIYPTAELSQQANSSLVGYLGVFFLGNDPDVYFYISNGNNAVDIKALNKGNPILKPTLGTGGVRDPSIVNGNGPDLGQKWYIIGTDLDIGKTTWDASQRKGSLSIHIWESTDLINWGSERLVKVENNDAGMVWAPDAIWDAEKGQYMVYWASKFYPASDSKHTGTQGPDMIRYAYTSDFRTFSSPQTYITASPASIIDLCMLPLTDSTYIRFIKNETATNVYQEISTGGLFGTWNRVVGTGIGLAKGEDGNKAYVRSGVEGPYAFLDNVTPNKVWLILDYFGGDGYRPFYETGGTQNAWIDGDRSGWPKNLRHGSVIGLTQDRYDALYAKWA